MRQSIFCFISMFVDGESTGNRLVSIGRYTVGINVLYFRQNIEFVKTVS